MALHSSTPHSASTEALDDAVATSRPYAWIVFALTFGLLLSDYMSRQVLNVVFPHLKSEWALTDTQLGALSGIVSLAVGVLAFPLSLLADRWGRIRSLVLMAGCWSLATLICGVARDYEQMFIARFLVGVHFTQASGKFSLEVARRAACLAIHFLRRSGKCVGVAEWSNGHEATP